MHLNRGVNQDGLKVNPQTDLNALWTAIGGKENFTDALAAELPAGAKLLDFDIQLFDAQPAQLGGFDDEWVYSGRLDNLSSCHAIAEAFAATNALEKDFQVAAFFNNEEVGSETREGAAGNFLKSVLEEVLSSVLPRLVKSPYKIYFQNIPLFMRVRKRFDAKKIRKIGWNRDFWAIFSEPWYCRNGCRFPGTPCP